MTASLEHERAIAEAAVLRAAILTKRIQSQVNAVPKADATPVTVADFAAQALLISALHAAFPCDGFLGEEDSSVLRSDVQLRDKVYEVVLSSAEAGGETLASPSSMEEMLDLIDLGGSGQGGHSGRFWVMDPIDGTATFLRGQQYAVSLALIENGKEIVGVLGCPSLKVADDGRVYDDVVDRDGLGVILTAVKGHGTTIRRFPSQAASLLSSPALPLAAPLAGPGDLKDLCFVDCQKSSSTNHELTRTLAAEFGAQYPGLDLWASHMRYAALVLGSADTWVRLGARETAVFHIWDNAGTQLIFTELGGKITDFDGKAIDFGAGRALHANKGMIAARACVHDAIFKKANEILAAEIASAEAQ